MDEQISQILETLQEIKTDQLSPQTWNEISKLILQRAIADPNFHQTYVSLKLIMPLQRRKERTGGKKEWNRQLYCLQSFIQK